MNVFSKDILGSVIVSFDTDANFQSRLRCILDLSGKVVLVINRFSKLENQQSFVDQLRIDFSNHLNENRLVILELSENFGIGHALNDGIKQLVGCEWLMFFDDDTVLLDGAAPAIEKEVFRAITQVGIEQFGILGLGYTHDSEHLLNTNSTELVEKHAVITSGSILRASTYREAGPFREDFFIDSVDVEYSMRLRRMGRKVLKSTGIFMFHPIGKTYTARFLGVSVTASEHNALRCYYIARNRVKVGQIYFFDSPLLLFYSMFQTLIHMSRIVLFEDNKKKKSFNLILGVWHGLQGRLGKLAFRGNS